MKNSGKWFLSNIFVFIIVIILFGIMATFAISREVPLGSISGRVIRSDTKKPIEGAKVMHPTRDTYVKTDKNGFYNIYGVPQGKSHTIRVNARGFYFSTYPKVKVTEGKATKNIDFRLNRRKSNYYLYSYQKVFSPQVQPSINLRGYMVKKVHLKIYKINPRYYINQISYSSRAIKNINVVGLSPVRELDFISRLNKEGEFEQTFNLPLYQNGLYLIKAKAVKGAMRKSTWILKSNLGLIVKRSPKKMLIYAQDFSTGRPVKNSQIKVYKNSYFIGGGKTNKDGLFQMRYYKGTARYPNIRVIAKSGESYAFSGTYGGYIQRQYKTYLYTERPVYRPGQVVYFKGIIRRRLNQNYITPANMSVNVRIRNTTGDTIYKKNLITNEFGSINGSIKLSDDASLGEYSLRAKVNGVSNYTSFKVSEYKKPEYKIEVTTDKPHYVSKDKIKVKIKGKYYFGAPVKNAKYRLTVLESPFYWGGWYNYYPQDLGYGGIIYEHTGRLNDIGEDEIIIPAPKVGHSKLLTIEAEVTDISGKAVTGSLNVSLSAGEFALYASTNSYISKPSEEVILKISAKDFNKKPVKNKWVQVKVRKIKYKEVIVRKTFITSSGRKKVYKEYKMKPFETFIGSPANLKTNEKGIALLHYTPKEEGNFYFDISSKDKRGNLIKFSTNVYVSSDGDGIAFNEADLKIITNKKKYNFGENVKAVITSSKPNTYVLLTVEGRKLYSHKVIRIAKGSYTLEIPLKKNYFPNVFIKVSAIRDMHLISDTANIKFNREEKGLKISIKPNKKRYRPGDEAQYKLIVKDNKGKPVKGEFSLGVVDEAVYAIAPDETPNIQNFFWNYDSNYVDTSYSFARDYSGGADKDRPIKVRKNFKDTAFWAPNVVTNKNGEAIVNFKFPDNLTTWVTTVRGSTKSTIVGSNINFVISTKDLLVRLETPRFLTQRDKIYIGGIVHNYTKKSQKVKVWLETEGVKLKNPDKIETVIKHDDAKDFYWEVVAMEPGKAKFTLFCRGIGAEDAMELKVPVYPFGVEEIKADTGELGQGINNRTLTLKLPEKVIKTASKMEILLSPSLAGTIFDNLNYLIKYPYGCVEQTMSSFLPALVAQRALGQFGIQDKKMEIEIPKVVSKGLKRLYDMQHTDGGWGWWKQDSTQPNMTAYVVMGLYEAQLNGYNISSYSLKSGIKALQKMAKKPVGAVRTLGNTYQEGEGWNTRAYVLYALYKVGYGDLKKTLEAFDKRKKMNPYAKALLAMTLKGLYETEKSETIMDELDKSAKLDSTKCHWDGRTFDYSWMDDKIETTAKCLEAYIRLRPKDPKIPRIIRWLIGERFGNRYRSTKDTAAVVKALTNYVLVSNEMNPDYHLKVALNNKSIVDHRVDKAKLPEGIGEIKLDYNTLIPGNNTINLEKQGQGILYYTARLRYYPKVDKIISLNQGIKINRTYKLLTYKTDRLGKIVEDLKPLPSRPLKLGEKLRVTITLEPDKDYRYVIIEDPFPAGFETTMKESEKNIGNRNWAQQEVHDEKIAFFKNRMKKGKKIVFSYDIRSEMLGEVQALPTMAYCMYSPEVRGHSQSDKLRVEK